MNNVNTRLRLFIAAAGTLAVHIGLVALAGAQDDLTAERALAGEVFTQIEGPNGVAADAVRFEALDVFVDSGPVPLAAYQFELESETPGVEIVGIEGGEHSAFSAPPYYDPGAMSNNRVILAAFSTAKDLPSGRSRVARVHVQLAGPGLKEYRTKLAVSATTGGEQIAANVLIMKAER